MLESFHFQRNRSRVFAVVVREKQSVCASVGAGGPVQPILMVLLDPQPNVYLNLNYSCTLPSLFTLFTHALSVLPDRSAWLGHVRPSPASSSSVTLHSDIRTCSEYGASLKVHVSWHYSRWPVSLEGERLPLVETFLSSSLQSVIEIVRNHYSPLIFASPMHAADAHSAYKYLSVPQVTGKVTQYRSSDDHPNHMIIATSSLGKYGEASPPLGESCVS